jgi:hypothetical protein
MASNMDKEIFWNIINSLLAGALVLFGSIADGEITLKNIVFAGIGAGIVAITSFKNYWDSEKEEYCSEQKKLFSFITC